MAASTQVITDMNTCITTGPSVATAAAVLSPAGKIMDYVGMLASVRLNMKETLNKLTLLVSVTDASDPNLTRLQNIVLTYS